MMVATEDSKKRPLASLGEDTDFIRGKPSKPKADKSAKPEPKVPKTEGNLFVS